MTGAHRRRCALRGSVNADGAHAPMWRRHCDGLGSRLRRTPRRATPPIRDGRGVGPQAGLSVLGSLVTVSADLVTFFGLSGSFIAPLKSRIARPNAPPTSPSLLGPKMIRMITSKISK